MQNFLPKHPFFFTSKTDLKMAKETNKGNVEGIHVKVTKHIRKGGESWSWSELTLNNWLWVVLLYIYIREQFSSFDTNTNVLTGLMISLFLPAPAPRVRRSWDLMGTSVRNGLRFFLLFGKKYFFIQKSSFIVNNFFGNVFQTLRVTGLIMRLYAKLRC